MIMTRDPGTVENHLKNLEAHLNSYLRLQYFKRQQNESIGNRDWYGIFILEPLYDSDYIYFLF